MIVYWTVDLIYFPMATLCDVRDILEVQSSSTDQPVTFESLIGSDVRKKKPRKQGDSSFKKPEGMHREVYALLYANSEIDVAPLVPSDGSGRIGGYKSLKAKLGLRKVRPWQWTPFANPARKDNLVLSHWRRVEDANKEYPFARFNKVLDIPTYSEEEYKKYLVVDGWKPSETEHLMSLCHQFDLRWPVIHDRWDLDNRFQPRKIEELKERYYGICNALTKARTPEGQEINLLHFDADHERRRKEQLEKLYNRTTEQIEDEEHLLEELRKIEARRRERERKAADLQKLIAAADTADIRAAGGAQSSNAIAPLTPGAVSSVAGTERKKYPKAGRPPASSLSSSGAFVVSAIASTSDPTVLDSGGGIKFADLKGPGVYLRSQRMKLPATLGQKKSKAVEQVLKELEIEYNPVATEDIAVHFNELRNDVVLLYDLKSALGSCRFEIETLRHQYQAVTGKDFPIPLRLKDDVTADEHKDGTITKKKIVDIIDLTAAGVPPIRKRKAIVETPPPVFKRPRRN